MDPRYEDIQMIPLPNEPKVFAAAVRLLTKPVTIYQVERSGVSLIVEKVLKDMRSTSSDWRYEIACDSPVLQQQLSEIMIFEFKVAHLDESIRSLQQVPADLTTKPNENFKLEELDDLEEFVTASLPESFIYLDFHTDPNFESEHYGNYPQILKESYLRKGFRNMQQERFNRLVQDKAYVATTKSTDFIKKVITELFKRFKK